MGLTTERKVFLALALVAGGSLIVDQAILSPKSASASGLDTNQISTLPNEPILAGITKPITKSVTDILNDRLGKVAPSNPDTPNGLNAQAAEIQRMFAPLVKPTPEPVAKQTSLKQPTPAVAIEPTEQLPTNLPMLTAVMPSRSGQSGAILNATLYKVGDSTPDGYTLLSVEQRKVLVGYKANKYWLTLPAFED